LLAAAAASAAIIFAADSAAIIFDIDYAAIQMSAS